MRIQCLDLEAEVPGPHGQPIKGRTSYLSEEQLQTQEIRAQIFSGRLKVFRFDPERPTIHELPVVQKDNLGQFSLEWRPVQ